MANQEHLDILLSGVEKWNAWRQHQRATIREVPDLSGVSLSGIVLKGVDFGGAHLTGVDLSFAYLSQAAFHGANLSNANFTDANLSWADFSGAFFHRTNFAHSTLGGTSFVDCDLNGILGLDSCSHLDHSIVDHRTLAQSGPVPLPFLRGCGFSDTFIEYIPSIFGQAIQFHSAFISYATANEDFAQRLHADLQNNGVRCWFAPHDMRGGQELDGQIDRAIQLQDRLLLILSPESMNSTWVRREIGKACKREDTETRKVLFPVRLIDFQTISDWEYIDKGIDYAARVRKFYIPDFGQWKHDHDGYRREFGKLLRDLKKTD